MKHTLSILLTLGSMTLSLGSMAQKTASQGIDEYRAMLQDGNPADLFEAKGEGLCCLLYTSPSPRDAYKTWNPGC